MIYSYLQDNLQPSTMSHDIFTMPYSRYILSRLYGQQLNCIVQTYTRYIYRNRINK